MSKNAVAKSDNKFHRFRLILAQPIKHQNINPYGHAEKPAASLLPQKNIFFKKQCSEQFGSRPTENHVPQSHFPQHHQWVITEEEVGRKLCLPVLVGVAQHQSYRLLISQLWRPREGETEGLWDFRRHEYSILLLFLHTSFHYSSHTHTHTPRCFSIQIHTRAYPTDSMSPSFSLHGLLVSSINVSPVYCKIGFSSADWVRCSRRVIVRSHPGQYIVLSYSKMPASSAGTLPSV